MNKRQIDNFFQALSYNIKKLGRKKAKILLTGAAAGNLLGGNRPSIDIDFALICDKRYIKDIEKAIRQTSLASGIAVNYSQDIDRWSEITFLDYKKHTIHYKTIGCVEISILSPDYWSIGKITRYIDTDVDDLVKVLKNNPISCAELSKLWGKALAKSPLSSASSSFKKHAEHFLKTYGKLIWGKNYNQGLCLRAFWGAAGIKSEEA